MATAPKHLESPEVRRDKDRLSPRAFEGSTTLGFSPVTRTVDFWPWHRESTRVWFPATTFAGTCHGSPGNKGTFSHSPLCLLLPERGSVTARTTPSCRHPSGLAVSSWRAGSPGPVAFCYAGNDHFQAARNSVRLPEILFCHWNHFSLHQNPTWIAVPPLRSQELLSFCSRNPDPFLFVLHHSRLVRAQSGR